MPNKDHERLANRLAEILRKLNQGERLSPEELAEEFGVHKRTIQRDLQERFAFLPLQKDGNYTWLEPDCLGRISMKDIKRFAHLAGLNGLFPGINTDFIQGLFNHCLEDPSFEIHAVSYEKLEERLDEFRLIQQAINSHQKIQFTYLKPDLEKQVEVDPYRLINNNGIWYLAAADQNQPKAYTFSKIKAPNLLPANFQPSPQIVAMLDLEDSIWLNEKKTEVVLTVAPHAAPYFRRRKLISQQINEKELENGGLIISGKFAHPDQIFPIIRYWLPHIRIVSPDDWQIAFENQIKEYLNN